MALLQTRANPPGNIREPRLLEVPRGARTLHTAMIDKIRILVKSETDTAIDLSFVQSYSDIMDIFEKYQLEVIRHSRYQVHCAKGCALCCFHWVEDVYSFEAEIIGAYVKAHFSTQRIGEIVAACIDDIKEIERLDVLISEKMAAVKDSSEAAQIDIVDLLLSTFYQLRRPCPLLEKNGACGIYPVRPITCRIYMNFSDPVNCEPDRINDTGKLVYLLDMEEEASELLDELHARFDRFGGDLGLRSLLIKTLR